MKIHPNHNLKLESLSLLIKIKAITQSNFQYLMVTIFTNIKLETKKIMIWKRAMGTTDAHYPWDKASFNIYKQLANYFGLFDPQ